MRIMMRFMPGTELMTLIRNPIYHVRSQWMHCQQPREYSGPLLDAPRKRHGLKALISAQVSSPALTATTGFERRTRSLSPTGC